MAAWTFRGAGTAVGSSSGAALTPTVTHSVGDLLLLPTAQRQGAFTAAPITGWTLLASLYTTISLELFGRIADGSATDSPTVDWSGTAWCGAWIEAYYGGGWTNIGTILDNSTQYHNSSYVTLAVANLTPNLDNCLVYSCSVKNKTAAGDDNTFTMSGDGQIERQEWNAGAGNRIIMASCSVQQTTAALMGTDWTNSGTEDAGVSQSITVSLKTQAAASIASRAAAYYEMLRTP